MVKCHCFDHVLGLSVSDFVQQGELEDALQSGLIDLGLRDSGVCVIRGDGRDRQLVKSCLEETQTNLERYLALPGPMSAAKQKRQFMRYSVCGSSSDASHNATTSFTHRRDFVMPISANIRALLTSVLSSPAGATVVSTLGCCNSDEVKLTELTVIVAEPGCEGQNMHSDAEFPIPCAESHSQEDALMITMFIPLHDILAEDQGPTWFVPNTHHPRCFPDGQWVPPASAVAMSNGLGSQSSSAVWFGPLYSGDMLLMQSTTWHRGGANTSDAARTILAASFCGCIGHR